MEDLQDKNIEEDVPVIGKTTINLDHTTKGEISKT